MPVSSKLSLVHVRLNGMIRTMPLPGVTCSCAFSCLLLRYSLLTNGRRRGEAQRALVVSQARYILTNTGVRTSSGSRPAIGFIPRPLCLLRVLVTDLDSSNSGFRLYVERTFSSCFIAGGSGAARTGE